MAASFERGEACMRHQRSDATANIDRDETVSTSPQEQRWNVARCKHGPAIRTRQRRVRLTCKQVGPSVVRHLHERRPRCDIPGGNCVLGELRDNTLMLTGSNSPASDADGIRTRVNSRMAVHQPECERLTTPLQFELYLTRAFEEAFRVGQKPVDADTVGDILAPDLDGLEARLTRNGYNAKVLIEVLGAKPKEVRAFLGGHLPPERTQEFHDRLLAAGVPL
ncbi:hypothetical protein [Paraburkholderia sp. MM6662-R1]|uniref:hypothetical protein n=1 Tax=Paraburkholderia sp. MM6662-R1 TaxID=2991066 RepID=UPI003D1941D8